MPTPLSSARPACAAAVCALLGIVASDGAAADRNWNNPAGGAFENAFFWTPALVPGASDRALFQLASTYTVSFGADRTVLDSRVTSGLVTWNSSTTVREYVPTDVLIVSGSTLVLSKVVVTSPGLSTISAAGNVLVSDVATLDVRVLNVSGAGGLLAGLNVIGPTARLESSYVPTGSIVIGTNGGNGSMNVGDGATLESNGTLTIADDFDPNVTGDVFVDGGATCTVRALLMNPFGGATTSATFWASGAGTTATVTNGLAVGNDTNGFAQMQVGGGASLDLGAVSNEIRPSGSLLLVGGTLIADHDLSVRGGSFTADSSSAIQLSDGVTLSASEGGTIDWDQNLLLDSAAPGSPTTLSVEGGALVEVAYNATLGNAAGTAGKATISGGVVTAGAGGTFVPSTLRGAGGGAGADLRVGVSGDGTLEIVDGGFVQFRDDGVFAANAGSSATLLVSGVDPTTLTPPILDLTIGGANTQLILGQNGDATVDFLAGAWVIVAGDTFLASGVGSSADVTLSSDGTGLYTELSIGDDLFIGGGAGAPGGTANLVIADDARLDVFDQVIIWDTGTVVIGGNSVMQGTTLQVEGTLRGSGDLEFATITNDGFIDPGATTPTPAVGVFNISDDFVQAADGVLRLDVFGQFSTQIDRLTVGGDLDLDGTLFVTNPVAFPLVEGSTYPIIQFAGTAIDADFDEIQVTGGLAGVTWVEGETVFLRLVAPCPEDLDGSGAVDFDDLLAVLGAWGDCPTSCHEDLDGSGSVDFADLLAVLGAWGTCG